MGLITKSELAKRAKRSPASVTQATRPGGFLHKAMVGKKLDAGHPEVIKYIQRGRDDYEKKNPTQSARDYRPTDEEVEETLACLPDDIRDLQDMSLRELIDMFGTSKAMTEFLKAVKDIEAIHKTRLETAEKEGKLVSRDKMQIVLDEFDTLFKRLLTDGARTISGKCLAMSLAGQTEKDLEKYVNERLSSFIQKAKARAVKVMRDKK